jgi:carbamoyl-phosphate synthase large subunit
MKFNILITSVGKRVVLTKLFQQTLRNVYPAAKVYTTDINPQLAPAGIISDRCFKVPKVIAPDYVNELIKICIENSISIIVPTIDTELLVLSENKSLFQKEGIESLVSDKYFINICRDKRNTNIYLEKLGIRTPKRIDKYHPTFPLFAKPYDGSLSKDLFVIKTKEELTPEIINHPKLIFMEYIDKKEYKEFTVDMYYGRDNRVKSIVPRERIEIRAGEINKGYTRKNYLVNFLKDRMNYLPGVVGCICIQLFYKEQDNDVIGIEINPRFGGGYPLSYYAKADFPSYIIQEYLQGKSIVYSDNWLNNALMLRYDDEIIVYDK